MKQNYPFHQLSSNDWKIGAAAGLDNAKEILIASALCKEKGIYTVSNSLLISASEELIKSIYIRVWSVVGKEPIKGFQKLFFDHKEKHQQIQKLFIISLSDENEKLPNEEKELAVYVYLIVAVFAAYAQSKRDISDRNRFDIEQSRLAGLYLDLNKFNKKWLIPKNEIDKESFEEYFKLITSFFEKVENEYFSPNSEKSVFKLFDQMKEIEMQSKNN